MEIWELAVVILAAVVPSLIYLVWIRNSEKYNRERWMHVLSVYLFGAIISIIAALFLETVAITIFYQSGSIFSGGFWSYEPYDPTLEIVILAVVIAPLVEEWTKGWGVMTVRNKIREPEDGFIYGAAAGLGFAAMENIFYNSSALVGGFDVFLTTALIRAVASTLLHASASAVLGYGIARKYLNGARGKRTGYLPYYLAAVVLHGLFNGFAVAGEVWDHYAIPIIGLISSTVLAIGMFLWMRRRLRIMDRRWN
ncbi:MAG TPA: PrsW family glutamic-type intramembrane protease [Methanomassiliicoccales archaeon]|nr:PrsW family glutamic-type intramembrane protease [Methanomassiliicoccales archaeon]